MAKMMILTKLTIINLFAISIIPLSDIVQKVAPEAPPTAVFWIFVCLMMTIEIGLVFMMFTKDFRLWVVTGGNMTDGVLKGKTRNDFTLYYASLWFARLFILNILLEKFYSIHADFQDQLLLFLGATGSQGIGVVKSIILKKYKIDNNDKI